MKKLALFALALLNIAIWDTVVRAAWDSTGGNAQNNYQVCWGVGSNACVYGNSVSAFIRQSIGGNDIVAVTATGLGILTDNPTNALSVSGNANVTGTLAVSGNMAGAAPAIQQLVAGSAITPACGGTTLIATTGAVSLTGSPTIAAPTGECHTLLVNGSTGSGSTITFPAVAALPAATGVTVFLGATGTAALPVGDIRNCAYNNTAAGPVWSCR